MTGASRRGGSSPCLPTIVGFDSEFQRICGGSNDVICISFCMNPATGETHSSLKIIPDGKDRRRRPPLAAIVSRAISEAQLAGVIIGMPARDHSGRALEPRRSAGVQGFPKDQAAI